jgi:hypothetical protein
MMITWGEVERQKWERTELGPYSGHFAVVLSLVFSLAVLAIISKNHSVSSLWADVVAFLVPIPIALHFERRIVRFGGFTCVAAIVLALGAAVLFGI